MAGQEQAGETASQNLDYSSYPIPPRSLWSILTADQATLGEKEKILQIKDYLETKNKKDSGQLYDVNRFAQLKSEMSRAYFVPTDAAQYLTEEYSETPEGRDHQERYAALCAHLDNFVDEKKVDVALVEAMHRASEANSRSVDYIQRLKDALISGERFWNSKNIKVDGAEYLEQGFPNILQRSLSSRSGQLNSSIRLAQTMSDCSSELGLEYVQSMRNIWQFLKSFNDREDLTFVDLMYDVAEHRDATTFRGSTSGTYAVYESLLAGISHMMPSQEQQRENIDLIHNCVDQNFQDLNYAYRLSYLNVKHRLELSPHEVDLFGTMTSMISTIMRGYGISEMDDRIKQYFHNSGDHSLRVCITIADARDANIERFRQMHKDGALSQADLDRQIELAEECARHKIKIACIHDTGEFLGELLGNNLIGKSETEERILRQLRDQVETYIMEEVVPIELDHRLKNGVYAHRWNGLDTKSFLESSLQPSGAFNFDTPFYNMIFDIDERLQTNHEIITTREVGRINEEGFRENSKNLSDSDVRYTMQYVYGKITGHKFQSVDPADIAQHHLALHKKTRDKSDFYRANQVALEVGAALPSRPDITRLQDIPNTSDALDVYMSERDIDYPKSIFKSFVKQTLRNHETLSFEEARARQMHDEALLHAVGYEMIHYAKKHARVSGLDAALVDKSVRKSVAQGVVLARAELRENRIPLVYLQSPEVILGQERYRWLSMNTTGTRLGNAERPQQLFEPMQGIARTLSDVFKIAHDGVVDPVFKIVKTPVQAMLMRDNRRVSEHDFRHLFEMAAMLEFGGDAGLTTMGMVEGTTDLDAGIDGKMFAALNPFVTWSLAEPQRRAEAIEKCYGHILNLHSEQIAEKYGVDGLSAVLRKREYLKKGEYHRKSSDITLSGGMSEEMYAYFRAQYGNDSAGGKNEKFEEAERYILHEMLINEIGKTAGRLAQETSPAQKSAMQTRLETLKVANRAIKTDAVFNMRAKYSSEIRFGIIGVLGLKIAGSDTGADLGMLPIIDHHVTTSSFFLNLAVAGFSAFLASAEERLQTMPSNNPVRRFLEDLPHFENGQDGGLYMVKGKTQTLNGKKGYRTLNDASKALISRHHEQTPNMILQCFDTLIAVPVTAIRALGNRKVSSEAFANQSTAQMVDTLGVLYNSVQKVFNHVASGIDAGVQIGAAILSNVCFSRVGVLNMYMHEIREDLKAGRDPNFESIQDRNSDRLRGGANQALLNLIDSVVHIEEKRPPGKLSQIMGQAIEKTGITDLNMWMLRRMYGVKNSQSDSEVTKPENHIS